MNGIRFDYHIFSGKLVGVKVSATDKSGLYSREMQLKNNLIQYGQLYGLENCYGKVAVIGLSRYALIGYNTRASKQPLLVKDLRNGKNYIISRNFSEQFKTSNEVYDPSTGKVTQV